MLVSSMVSLVTLYSHSLRVCSTPQSLWPLSIPFPWGWALLGNNPFGHCPCSLLESIFFALNLFLFHPSLHLVWISLVVITRTRKLRWVQSDILVSLSGTNRYFIYISPGELLQESVNWITMWSSVLLALWTYLVDFFVYGFVHYY